jgi:hypothetical protein
MPLPEGCHVVVRLAGYPSQNGSQLLSLGYQVKLVLLARLRGDRACIH